MAAIADERNGDVAAAPRRGRGGQAPARAAMARRGHGRR